MRLLGIWIGERRIACAISMLVVGGSRIELGFWEEVILGLGRGGLFKALGKLCGG